ncbi:hypothetical protein [Acinetobacter pittii]|uniref:hypothetical protein n=1 Tax=Acinetobacter pittii TaxID=48296 RepID=UPI001901B150|nr:hypothetical protein [Acinetobacter pittii]MBJ8433054.1 hypothetical protein [Acinetobacter pittii]
MKQTIEIEKLTFNSSIDYCEKIRDILISDIKKIELDFRNLRTIEPFGIVYFSNFIKTLTRLKDVDFTCIFYDDENISYAKHMGLFQNCGFDIGKKPREQFPTCEKNHIPITIIDVETLKKEARDSYEEVGQIIENYSENLAKLLTSQKETILVDTLTYCFREILRNVVEHSESSKITFCAQYWPYLKKAEIVVLDRGKGIKNSLNENDTLPYIENDKDALNFALLPSISSKVPYGKKQKRRSDDFWKNSGFGLYMTHRIAGMGGDFFIASGKHGLQWVQDEKRDYKVRLKGTILRMVIQTNNISTLQETLGKFRTEGFALAQELTKMDIEPSTASLMLSKHRNT